MKRMRMDEKEEEEKRNLSGKLLMSARLFYVATFCLLLLLINYSSNDAFLSKKGHSHSVEEKINVRCRSKLLSETIRLGWSSDQ
jgi:hypothetical protein